MKLTKTEDYLLFTDEKGEININDYWIYLNDNEKFDGVITKSNLTEKEWYSKLHDRFAYKKIIAYYPLTKEAKELDLPLLPVTSKDKWGTHETHCCEKHGCKYGDNDCCVAIGIVKAKYPCEYCDDDKNDRQFSLEDMRKAIEMARKTFISDRRPIDRYSTEDIIQSLSNQQLPKEFIPEYENKCWCLKPINGGCFECTKMLKTITNSEGKQELVGKYVY